MADNAHISQDFISSVIAGEAFADASLLAFRDSSSFRAGELHRHIDQWDKLFQSSDNNFSEVLDWNHNFIHVDKFFTHYKGSYKGVNYNCDRPPARIFANHPSCKAFAQFISDTLIERLASGAISLWGKVGECTPPHLVMPRTVEPTKPRLCNDDRFLNLWTQDRPFKLDSVQHLPKYVLPGFFQTVCDDKSGYDHIQLSMDSRTFFLDSSGADGFLSVVVFHLVGNRPPTFITPLSSLPLIIYGRLAFHLRCTSTTVTVVSFLSLMVVFRLLIKICPPRIALIWL